MKFLVSGTPGDARSTEGFRLWARRGDYPRRLDRLLLFFPEDITAPLSGFHSDYADDELTPGLVQELQSAVPMERVYQHCYRANDMAKPALQQSVYRLALYAGKPVEAPAGIPIVSKETSLHC